MKWSDLDDFVVCYNPENHHERAETWSEGTPKGRYRADDYDNLVSLGKCSLDLFWLKDDSLLDTDNLPDPDEIAQDLRSALEQIEETIGALQVEAL